DLPGHTLRVWDAERALGKLARPVVLREESSVSPDPVAAKSTARNPSPDELQAMTAEMPSARKTVYGNYNVATKVVARSAASTYIVTDEPERHRGHQTIPRAEFERVAKIQDEYIRAQEMVAIDGYIGSNPDFLTGALLLIET